MNDLKSSKGCRSSGCLRTALIVSAVAALLITLIAVVGVIAFAFSSRQTRSGNGIVTRPTSTSPSTTMANARGVAPSIPAGTESVTPLAEDELLFSVAENPPLNPCSDSGPDFDIEVMKNDGTGRRLLAGTTGAAGASTTDQVNTDSEELWPRLSPDRRRFVFYRAPTGITSELCRYEVEELWIANADGTNGRRIFSNDDKLAVAKRLGWDEATSIQGHADWAPDGRHVVMVLGHVPRLGPVPLMSEGETELFVLDVDTGDLRQVTRRVDSRGRGLSSDPSFAPDGKHIIFVGCPDATPSCSDVQLRSVPADSQNAKETSLVFDGPDRAGNDVYVSPDGKSISWMEVGILEIKLFVAPFAIGTVIDEGDVTLIDNHAGYANWTSDSSELIYSPLRLGERFSLFAQSFDGSPSQRLTPVGSSEAFMFPSP
jgi:Tol biopolymer transport system component